MRPVLGFNKPKRVLSTVDLPGWLNGSLYRSTATGSRYPVVRRVVKAKDEWDLNPQHPLCRSGALPIELLYASTVSLTTLEI